MLHAMMASIALILDGEQILLMQCGETKFAPGKWLVIGGKVDPGETPDEAVRREVYEETGLTLTEYRHAGHVFLYEADGGVTSLNLYVATAFAGQARGSEEGEPVWWPLEQAMQLDLIGYLRLLLPHVLAPRALVLGTIKIGPHGEVLDWSLERHTVAETVAVAG